MKKFLVIPLMIVLAAFFVFISGCAQQEGTDQAQAPGEEQRAQQLEQPQQQAEEGQLQNSFRLSQLMDFSVQTQQGQDLGNVEDVVVDKQGRSTYIILSGANLGKEDELIAVPLQVANPQVQDDKLVISLDQQMLMNAPAFPKDNWAQLEQNREQINAYFGGAGATEGGMQGEHGMMPSQPSQQQTQGETQ